MKIERIDRRFEIIYRLLLLILVYFFWASTVQGQDPIRDHRIAALKGLKDVDLVLRPNVKSEVLSHKEIVDTCELSLKQRIPELQVKESSKNWLEICYITSLNGGFVEISLYRWVTVIATGEDVYAKVWDDKRVILGPLGRADLREFIDTLLISFAADFTRANQKGEKN